VTGRPVDDTLHPLDPVLSESERQRGREQLAAALGPAARAPGSLYLLHPGVEGDPRTWPAERFGELAKRLIAGGARVLILTGPGEASIGQQLESDIPGAAHLVGQRGLRELAGLFAAAAEQEAKLFVSDSGPAHVAASVGLAVRLLAGPEDPSRTGPWPLDASGHHAVVGADGEAGWSAPRPITEIRTEDALLASGLLAVR
ncbi:MAG: glycosyltransferase family 9 protein, partial [Planctomycetota bacterium]